MTTKASKSEAVEREEERERKKEIEEAVERKEWMH